MSAADRRPRYEVLDELSPDTVQMLHNGMVLTVERMDGEATEGQRRLLGELRTLNERWYERMTGAERREYAEAVSAPRSSRHRDPR